MMVPSNADVVPSVAELPTCQKTFVDLAPPLVSDDGDGARGKRGYRGRAGGFLANDEKRSTSSRIGAVCGREDRPRANRVAGQTIRSLAV
jgi:hypothetical protein